MTDLTEDEPDQRRIEASLTDEERAALAGPDVSGADAGAEDIAK